MHLAGAMHFFPKGRRDGLFHIDLMLDFLDSGGIDVSSSRIFASVPHSQRAGAYE